MQEKKKHKRQLTIPKVKKMYDNSEGHLWCKICEAKLKNIVSQDAEMWGHQFERSHIERMTIYYLEKEQLLSEESSSEVIKQEFQIDKGHQLMTESPQQFVSYIKNGVDNFLARYKKNLKSQSKQSLSVSKQCFKDFLEFVCRINKNILENHDIEEFLNKHQQKNDYRDIMKSMKFSLLEFLKAQPEEPPEVEVIAETPHSPSFGSLMEIYFFHFLESLEELKLDEIRLMILLAANDYTLKQMSSMQIKDIKEIINKSKSQKSQFFDNVNQQLEDLYLQLIEEDKNEERSFLKQPKKAKELRKAIDKIRKKLRKQTNDPLYQRFMRKASVRSIAAACKKITSPQQIDMQQSEQNELQDFQIQLPEKKSSEEIYESDEIDSSKSVVNLKTVSEIPQNLINQSEEGIQQQKETIVQNQNDPLIKGQQSNAPQNKQEKKLIKETEKITSKLKNNFQKTQEFFKNWLKIKKGKKDDSNSQKSLKQKQNSDSMQSKKNKVQKESEIENVEKESQVI